MLKRTWGAILVALWGSGVSIGAPFPIGIYDVRDTAQLKLLHQTGFNWVVYSGPGGEPAESFLREAKRKKVGVIATHAVELDSAVKRTGFMPVWYVTDEPDVHKIRPEDFKRMDDALRKLYPAARTTFAVGSGDAAEKYRDSGDFLMVDWYPVPHLPLDSVADHLDTAKRGAKGKPVWMILQAFDWRDYRQKDSKKPRIGRFPSFTEIRFMTYLSLVHDSDGIFYYSFRKGNDNLLGWPEDWQALSRVVNELKILRPILERGKPIAPPFPINDGIETKVWRYHGRNYVVVLNRSNEPRRIPAELLETNWRPLFDVHRLIHDLLVRKDVAWCLHPHQVIVLESSLL